MSQQETRIGKIKLIEKLENENLEQQCKRILDEANFKVDDCCDTYKEAIEEYGDFEKYIIYKNNLYEVIEDIKQDDCDIFEANMNEDGTISYTVSYYNGGCCLSEAIERSLKKLKSS